MIKLLLTGCNGRMGKAIVRAAAESGVYEIVAGVDLRQDTETYTKGSFPVFERLTDVAVRADVIVDFSHHNLTEALLSYAEEQRMPAVIATTGHTDEEKQSYPGHLIISRYFIPGTCLSASTFSWNWHARRRKCLDRSLILKLLKSITIKSWMHRAEPH